MSKKWLDEVKFYSFYFKNHVGGKTFESVSVKVQTKDI